MTATQTMDETVNNYFRFIAATDLPGVLSLLTDDVELDPVGDPRGALRGKQQAPAFYEGLFTGTEPSGVTPLVRLHGDSVTVDEVQWEGYTSGEPMGLSGPRTLVSFRLLHVFEFRDDLLSRVEFWLDRTSVEAQLRAPVSTMP